MNYRMICFLIGHVFAERSLLQISDAHLFYSSAVTVIQRTLFYPISHLMTPRYKGSVTYGIKARVESSSLFGLKLIPHISF